MPNTMTQVKFTIEAEIVSAFKARCATEGVSILIGLCRRSNRLPNPSHYKAITAEGREN